MTGAKHDQGKLQLSLIPSSFIKGIGRVLTFGAKKYSARNWEQGIDYDRVYSALQRHLNDWWGGERVAPESGIHHLYHAGCCLMFLSFYEQKGMHLDWDKRPWTQASPEPELPFEGEVTYAPDGSIDWIATANRGERQGIPLEPRGNDEFSEGCEEKLR